MPRTTTLECSGCPPLRALTFDVLGLIKVIEARSKEGGVAKVVEKWGEPDPSKCLLVASIDDRKSDPLLAVARKSGAIEILNPLNGDVRATISRVSDDDIRPEDDAIAGLHILKTKGLESASRSCSLLTCTTKGNAIIRSVEVFNAHEESSHSDSSSTFNVCASGSIVCSKVDGNENYAVFGGKGVEVNMWDLDTCSKIWTAKSPPKNSLGIFTPTWFTSAAFMSKDDHRKFVAGTNSHKVHLYDVSAQRRPVLSFDFRETAIKAVAEDLDGHKVYVGNGSGDLASFDMRTGKLLGCFLGKCSGSIRSIARHPELPVIASCGLDSYLRLWDVNTRQLLSAVFLKQHLTNVVFDSNFDDEAILHENVGSSSSSSTTPFLRLKVHDSIYNDHIKRSDFPKDFLFGTSTSAPQEDVKALKKLGIDTYRFSISWTRILPDGTLSGGINKEGIEYYNNLIDDLIEHGIKPFVTIFHFDSPQALQDKYGGFLTRSIVDDFRDFCDICFMAFGDRVKHWITVNEPLVIAQCGHDIGIGAPGRCSQQVGACSAGNSSTEPYIVSHNLLIAHGPMPLLLGSTRTSTKYGLID